MRKCLNVTLCLLTAAVFVILISFMIPVVMGYKPFAIISGSMEPKYHVGSVVFAVDTEPEDIHRGDCITYAAGDATATHRVLEVRKDERVFITRGDANKIQDKPVPFSKLIGRTSDFSIPLLGYAAVFMKEPAAKLGAAVLLAVLAVISAVKLVQMYRRRKVPKEPDILSAGTPVEAAVCAGEAAGIQQETGKPD